MRLEIGAVTPDYDETLLEVVTVRFGPFYPPVQSHRTHNLKTSMSLRYVSPKEAMPREYDS